MTVCTDRQSKKAMQRPRMHACSSRRQQASTGGYFDSSQGHQAEVLGSERCSCECCCQSRQTVRCGAELGRVVCSLVRTSGESAALIAGSCDSISNHGVNTLQSCFGFISIFDVFVRCILIAFLTCHHRHAILDSVLLMSTPHQLAAETELLPVTASMMYFRNM